MAKLEGSDWVWQESKEAGIGSIPGLSRREGSSVPGRADRGYCHTLSFLGISLTCVQC